MDISAVSEYEYVSEIKEYSESALYEAINNVLSVTTTNGNKIFCAFCAKIFEFKFAFLDHLKNNHSHFLLRVIQKCFVFKQCPFCYANFFGMNVIIKHVLMYHSQVVAQLYLRIAAGADIEARRCLFCNDLYQKKFAKDFVTHIENEHFLPFTELFEDQFMKVKESFMSPKLDYVGHFNSPMQNLPACSKDQNCFDFSALKATLNNVEDPQKDLKSVVKCSAARLNTCFKKTKVCRILQFDIPEENKENSVLNQNIMSLKCITLDEHSLLCNGKSKEQMKFLQTKSGNSPTRDIEPVYSSTPKSVSDMQELQPLKKVKFSNVKCKLKEKKKPTFRSYLLKKGLAYECGKCKKLFQENSELHCHIKKKHKIFILNLLHPWYQCAICKAKFFKNYYLKKHIVLHSHYKETLP